MGAVILVVLVGHHSATSAYCMAPPGLAWKFLQTSVILRVHISTELKPSYTTKQDECGGGGGGAFCPSCILLYGVYCTSLKTQLSYMDANAAFFVAFCASDTYKPACCSCQASTFLGCVSPPFSCSFPQYVSFACSVSCFEWNVLFETVLCHCKLSCLEQVCHEFCLNLR